MDILSIFIQRNLGYNTYFVETENFEEEIKKIKNKAKNIDSMREYDTIQIDKVYKCLIEESLICSKVSIPGLEGEEVVIENKSIKPSEVMGPNVPGKKIGVSGDTRPTKKLEVFFKNCDYLVFDSTYLDELKEKAIQTCHSTAKEAATFAKNANVSNLILTHFSARYKDGNVLLEEAKTIHNSVIAANDQLKIDIV